MGVALRFAGQALATVVVLVAAVALLAGVIVPRLAGATPYTVQSRSMEPSLRVGDLIVTRPARSVGTGDVITYQVASGQEQVVTHRVIGLGTTAAGERVYRTRGDANEANDVTPVREVQIRGTLWYRVPLLGYAASWFSGQQRQGIATATAAVLLGYAAWNVVGAARDRRDARKAAGTGAARGANRGVRRDQGADGQGSDEQGVDEHESDGQGVRADAVPAGTREA